MSEPAREPNPVIRLPKQARSKEAWRRILDAGRELVEEGGPEALSILAVCEAADVAPTAIYARVDGITGLFAAIYQDGMSRVVKDYTRKLDATEATPAGTKERAEAVVDAVVSTFSDNARFLDSIISHSLTNKLLVDRGGIESRKIVARVTQLICVEDAEAASDVARMLHQECSLRSMYGNQWLTEKPESEDAFRERLQLMADARLGLL